MGFPRRRRAILTQSATVVWCTTGGLRLRPTRGIESLPFPLLLCNRQRVCPHASVSDREHCSRCERILVALDDGAKESSHLRPLQAFLSDPDDRRTLMAPNCQPRVEVRVQRDGHPVMLPAPTEKRPVIGAGEIDLAGVDHIEPLVAQQLGRPAGDALVEEELHDAVGRSAFSSPTMAAA